MRWETYGLFHKRATNCVPLGSKFQTHCGQNFVYNFQSTHVHGTETEVSEHNFEAFFTNYSWMHWSVGYFNESTLCHIIRSTVVKIALTGVIIWLIICGDSIPSFSIRIYPNNGQKYWNFNIITSLKCTISTIPVNSNSFIYSGVEIVSNCVHKSNEHIVQLESLIFFENSRNNNHFMPCWITGFICIFRRGHFFDIHVTHT